MTNILRMTAATAALLLATTPALAAPTSATQNAGASAKIVKPLSLTSTQDLDLGTITLSGGASATVGVSYAGAWTCPAAVTCSGTHQVAKYKVTGVNNQTVKINAPAVTLNNAAAGTSLILSVDSPGTMNLGNSGTVGTEFSLGGNITVDGTTADGTYSGQFAVTVEYN